MQLHLKWSGPLYNLLGGRKLKRIKKAENKIFLGTIVTCLDIQSNTDGNKEI